MVLIIIIFKLDIARILGIKLADCVINRFNDGEVNI